MKKLPLVAGVFIFVLFFLIAYPTNSSASAWVRDKGEGLFFYNIYLSEFRGFYTANGERQSQESFYKVEFKPYFEYGVTNELTLAISPSFQHITTSGFAGEDSNYALQYTEFYFKHHLYSASGFSSNFETILELPGFYSERETPTFGKKEYFIQPRLNMGKAWRINNGVTSFIQVGGGVKSRFYDYFGRDSGSAAKFDATIGFNINQQFEYFLRYDSTRSLAGFNSQLNVLDRFGFNLDKIELSSVRHYGQKSLEVSYSIDVSGKNIGSGETVKFSIWQRF